MQNGARKTVGQKPLYLFCFIFIIKYPPLQKEGCARHGRIFSLMTFSQPSRIFVILFYRNIVICDQLFKLSFS